MTVEQTTETLEGFLHMLLHPETTLVPVLMSDQSGSASHSKRKLREVCQYLFKEVEELSKAYHKLRHNGEEEAPETLSGLDQLYIGTDEHPVDAETLWGQLELQNAALQPLLKKSLKRVIKSVEREGKDEVRLLSLEKASSGEQDESEEDSDSGREDYEDEEADEFSSKGEEEEEGVDEETKRMRQRMERAMADMDDSDSNNNDKADDETKETNHNDDESLVDPAAEELNNGFFDINEMEAFADEEEEYLPDEAFGKVHAEETQESEKKSFHQRQREGDVGSDNSSDEEDEEVIFGEATTGEPSIRRRRYREDDEVRELYKLYQKPESDREDEDDDGVVNMTAADLFGMPNKKYFHKWKASNQNSQRSQAVDEDDADSWDDHDFENDTAPGWRDPLVEETEGHENDEIEEGDQGEMTNEDESPDGTPVESSKPVHAKASDKLRRQTEQLEKEMLMEKPWQMTGETKSMSRPVNSLLEATPEFEVATKMAPLITVEHTANLEDVIKRRILNEDWDDVIPRELPDIGWHKKRSEAPEVSQEKSKLGLGELYEREYLKKAVGYDVEAVEKQTEEDKAKNEMKALFANLCSKLDALSNYHFAPRPISEEAEVRPVTTPAIAMEEVMPLHVSDARGVAPEEVYGKKRGREGVFRGQSELDQTERKRLRGAKKAARRKRRKEKVANEKLVSRLEPGLGLNNAFEKRKAREDLSMARAQGKITTGEVDVDADYGASGKLFKRMQEQVENSIRGDGSATKKKQAEHQRHGQKSSAFKL